VSYGTDFYPKQNRLGWILCAEIEGEVRALSRTGMHGTLEDRLMFGREQDVKAAIMGMAEQGILSPIDVMKRDRSEVVRICIESLGW
jgi:hypothetical protein